MCLIPIFNSEKGNHNHKWILITCVAIELFYFPIFKKDYDVLWASFK
jgi:hypothetical protein